MKENTTYRIKDIICIPLNNAPLEALFIIIQKLLDGLIPTILVVITARFIDIAISIFNKTDKTKSIIIPAIMIVFIVAYQWFSQQIEKFARVKLENKLRCKFRCDIVENVASLKYKNIESEESWDLITRVLKGVETKCTEAYIDTLDMLSMIIRALGLLAVIFIQVWWSAIFIVSISIPVFFIGLKGGKVTYEAIREVAKYNRKEYYLDEVLTGREAVDERSIFRYAESVNQQWIENYETARKINFKVNFKWFIKSKICSIITTILSIIIVLILMYPVKSGILSIGMFMSIVNNSFRLVNLLGWVLPDYGNTLSRNNEFIKDLNEFFALEGNKEFLCTSSSNKIIFNTLEFKNISFKYPYTEKYIIKNLSFKIEKGRHYAFVGANGTGKTTISKLITGLYDEFEGDILINGKSIREYNQEELKSLFSVVYQDFARYSISLKDNILLGDVNKKDIEKDINKVIDIMELDDVVQKLTKGLDTNLGKVKGDGIDLSIGQWQRIAMARSLISTATLQILDEPTAALDPISESNMYEKFQDLSKGKTTICISHRLASTKLADEIFVIDEGQIIEKGSYKELIEIKGVYSLMYESQRSWYL